MKVFKLMRLTAASRVGGVDLPLAARDFQTAFPGDPAFDVVGLTFLRQKDPDAYLATIARLEARVGGDPYLVALRADAYLDKGDARAAKEWAGRAVREEPALEHGYWPLVDLALAERDFAETARLLDAIVKNCDRRSLDVTKSPKFADFVKSKEYESWRTRRRESGK